MAFGSHPHDEGTPELGQPTKISFGGVYNHFVLVPVSVNGEPPADFILDTGAPTTVVDPAFAARAGISGLRSAEGMGAAGAMRASVAQVQSMQVGPARAECLMVGVVDKFTALRPIVPTVVGSLGIDFLRSYVVDVDYVAGTIAFDSPAHVEAATGEVPFLNKMLLFVKAFVNDRGPFDFAVDTGAEMSVISPDLVSELGLQTFPAPDLFGLGGDSPNLRARSATLEHLDVSGYRFEDFDVAVGSFFEHLRAATGVAFCGVLGYTFFEGKCVRFDFPRYRLSLMRRR